MPDGLPFFPESIVARAAFELLSSSSIERYVRVADYFAATPELRLLLEVSDIGPADLLNEADARWRTLTRARQREPQEVELALLLGLLATSASPDVDAFLTRLALHDRLPLAWSSAHARELLRRRPSNEVSPPTGPTIPATPVAAHSFAEEVDLEQARHPTFDFAMQTDEVSDRTLIAA